MGKNLIKIAVFTTLVMMGLMYGEARADSKSVGLRLIEIKASKKGPSKNKYGTKLVKYKKITKNLDNYNYGFYELLFIHLVVGNIQKEVQFSLWNKMILKIVPTKVGKKWISLKIQILKKIPSKKKKQQFKKVATFVQKVKNKATFLVRLQLKKGALFLAITAWESNKKATGKVKRKDMRQK